MGSNELLSLLFSVTDSNLALSVFSGQFVLSLPLICSFICIPCPLGLLLLTLGAHARGLRYLVCVCLSGTTSPATTGPLYVQRSVQPKVLKYGVFSKYALFKSYGVKKPTSLVRAYRDIIWCRWSDISPQIAKTEPFLVLSKSNGRLQATWQ